jgi:transposase
MSACLDEFKESEDLPNMTDPDDWARISAKKGDRIVYIISRKGSEVACELGINHETLRNWVAAERRPRADGPAALSADECMEFARLRRKVAELALEREILTRAAVFLTRETDR